MFGAIKKESNNKKFHTKGVRRVCRSSALILSSGGTSLSINRSIYRNNYKYEGASETFLKQLYMF